MKNPLIHIGILFILLGVSSFFIKVVNAAIKDYYSDLDKSHEIVKNVEDNYSLFMDTANNVKNTIVDVSKSYNFYLVQFVEKSKTLQSKFNTVEQEIENINGYTKKLIDNCKYDLNNSLMDSKCSSYKVNYINMINSYKEMIDEYNKIVDSYNTYAKKHGVSVTKKYEYQLSEDTNTILKELG